jgi:uncharacterized protein (TIGR00290 family)
LSWSSGKDSAFALHVVRQQNAVEVVDLLTTVNAAFARVAMHAVREELVDRQAAAVGLALWKVPLPWPCPNDAYEVAMRDVVQRAVNDGISVMVFGDLFLQDIRAYRERQLQGTGLTPLFPLWQHDTAALAREMLATGQRATLTCIDPKQLDATFCGRHFDAALLAALPTSVDPCGERGEFHTFAWDGPAFRHPVPITVGETLEREGFVFTDLLPA